MITETLEGNLAVISGTVWATKNKGLKNFLPIFVLVLEELSLGRNGYFSNRNPESAYFHLYADFQEIFCLCLEDLYG